MRRHTWQASDYQAILDAARSGLDPRGISAELGVPAATVRAVLEKAQRDPMHAIPRPRGGAHNLVYDRESVLDALRTFLVRPENGGTWFAHCRQCFRHALSMKFKAFIMLTNHIAGDATIKEMIAFLESSVSKSPGKSTLAEWLDGGLLVFPATAFQQAPYELSGSYEDWLSSCGGNVVYIGELVTAIWTKRARGPTARVGAPPGPMPRASTLIAADKDGVRLSAKSYDAAPTAADFTAFVVSTVTSAASRQGVAASEIGVVCDRRYLEEGHVATLTGLTDKAWVFDERSAPSITPISAAIEAARLQVIQHAQQINHARSGITLVDVVASSLA